MVAKGALSTVVIDKEDNQEKDPTQMVHKTRFSAITFNDEVVTPFAGLAPVMALADQLGVESSITSHLPRAPGEKANLAAKASDLLATMCVGGDFFEYADVLRNRASKRLLGRSYAATTLGQMFRSLDAARAGLFDKVLGDLIEAAWRRVGAPVDPIIDVDSTICEVYGSDKESAAYGYTKVLGYHPQLATLAGSNEVLGVKMRPGNANTGVGGADLALLACARAKHCGATGKFMVRADTGFSSYEFVSRLHNEGIVVSVGMPVIPKLKAIIDAIPDDQWVALAGYSKKADSTGWLAALDWEVTDPARPPARPKRKPGPQPKDGSTKPARVKGTLVIRRVTHDSGETFEHFAFFTTTPVDPANPAQVLGADKTHRAHAVVERSIRDLKSAAWAHFPSGRMGANTAWAHLGCIAHNLLVWAGMVARGSRKGPMIITLSIRRWLVCVPGRVLKRGRSSVLSLPKRWPHQGQFLSLAKSCGVSP